MVRRPETLEEVAESGRLSRRRLLNIAGGSLLLLFLLGWTGLSWYFSSERFQAHIDQFLRPRLAGRGVRFDDLEVSPLGKISITNLRIRLPNGEELVIERVEGYTNPAGLLRGEAKVTLDVTDLARRYFAASDQGVSISEDSKILYVSFAAKILDPREIRGEVHLEGVGLDVRPPGKPGLAIPFRFEDGTLSLIGDVLTSAGTQFRIPARMAGLAAAEGELLEMSFEGNIRRLFSQPEFVAGKVETRIRTEPMWAQALEVLNLAEVSRKIRWYGPLDISAGLDGPVYRPDVQGRVGSRDLLLKMKGEFREIDILFAELGGEIHFGRDSGWTMNLTGGKVRGMYYRLRDQPGYVATGSGAAGESAAGIAAKMQHLKSGARGPKRLYLSAEAFRSKATYRDRVLTLHDLAFAAYGGRAIGTLVWDLNVRKVPLSGTLTGDTAYNYRLGMEDLELGAFMQDVTALERPFEGRLTGLLEGRGRTLMLERMAGSGNVRIQGLRVGKVPRPDLLRDALGGGVARGLEGIDLGDAVAAWDFTNGQLRLPQVVAEGPGATLAASLSYQILDLRVEGNLRLQLGPGLVASRPNLAGPMRDRPVLEAAVVGVVVEPQISYRATAAPGGA